MSPTRRPPFELPPGVLLLDPLDTPAIDRHLLARGLTGEAETPCQAVRAGAGNMNLTLRVRLGDRTLILKQGRPWVEKYDHIAAPWDRTLVEGAFYRAAQEAPDVASQMPALLDLDTHNHVLALEDLGSGGDVTSMYDDRRLDPADLDALLAWLSALRRVSPAPETRDVFANRAMRALNHEHIFHFPLTPGNGLDLDAITAGLSAAAEAVQQDAAYCTRIAALGSRYLADGPALVHGDYFPGSWVRTPAGVRIIDPEFCFLGVREFDYGVMIGHFALARTGSEMARRVLAAGEAERLDVALLLGFAGTEIMRRLIGVAQLPLPYGTDEKRRLLDVSRSLVLEPDGELACW